MQIKRLRCLYRNEELMINFFVVKSLTFCHVQLKLQKSYNQHVHSTNLDKDMYLYNLLLTMGTKTSRFIIVCMDDWNFSLIGGARICSSARKFLFVSVSNYLNLKIHFVSVAHLNYYIFIQNNLIFKPTL